MGGAIAAKLLARQVRLPLALCCSRTLIYTLYGRVTLCVRLHLLDKPIPPVALRDSPGRRRLSYLVSFAVPRHGWCLT